MVEALGILVGGGPAPGINGVIGAAAIEAINRGVPVFGIEDGFSRIMSGDKSRVRRLEIGEVSRIHREGGSMLGTSRANPAKSPDTLAATLKSLQEVGIGYLVTIGGDDTASSAYALSQAAKGSLSVGHVPKTIDNDLPLPESHCTFGFQSACEAGMHIVETLMTDALSTRRWYIVVAMGRKAGHLALGIGMAAGATLTIIPEEVRGERVTLKELTDVIAGAIVKRLVSDRPFGVVVLAEGLAEKLDPESIPELRSAERDPHGHIRYVELDFAGMVKRAVRERLNGLNLSKVTVVEKNVGYELRCVPPNSFDREYTRMLGFGVVDFLLGGGSGAMISRQRDNLVPIPFSEMVDPSTGRARVRFVELSSAVYRVASKYMIRLNKGDLASSQFAGAAGKISGLSADSFRKEFAAAANWGQVP